MPRFVILEHDHPHLHWDLMFEVGAILRTWRLEAPPLSSPSIPAEPLGDHRLHYLDYEGPVSGGRGTVQRWDAGTFTGEVQDSDRITVRLEGQRCRGLAVLQRDAAGRWSFTLSLDQE
jgi:hypothetical protein